LQSHQTASLSNTGCLRFFLLSSIFPISSPANHWPH
jgi:hypothetical protein